MAVSAAANCYAANLAVSRVGKAEFQAPSRYQLGLETLWLEFGLSKASFLPNSAEGESDYRACECTSYSTKKW